MTVAELSIENLQAERTRRQHRANWQAIARPEQLPPDGDWRVWYLRGGRGAGKTRTGAETLADWILAHPPGEWAIVAPTFGDARAVCTEGPSGIIKALGGRVEKGGFVSNWNRSEGVVTVRNGSTIVLDGANDGAFRVQGHNLCGVWADEVGLWERWDDAWHQSISFAVRMEPGKIIATGTPKMAHPLIAHLLSASNVAHTHMRTIDNAANLDEAALADLVSRYGGSTLGRQELEGEFIEALDGELLNRKDWQWFDCREMPVSGKVLERLPRFDQIVHSWDTAIKGKASSDPVAGQVWGCAGPDRYLLRIFHARTGLDGTIVGMTELLAWARSAWPGTPQKVLIETSANGADAIMEMRRRVDGIYAYNPRDGGDKVRRALAASPALETGHCFLPGFKDNDPNGRGYTSDTPLEVQAFVEEAAQFRGDMKHLHDDQVDAWSQMVNWTRQQPSGRSGIARAKGRMPRVGQLGGVS